MDWQRLKSKLNTRKLIRGMKRHARKTVKAAISIIVAVAMLASFQPLPPAQAATNITTSTWTNATGFSFQRRTWHDGARYWSAFCSGSNIVFYYSTDGSSWTQDTSATISTSINNDFSIQADSSNAFIVYKNSYDIEARKASSYPGTGFSWGAATIVYDGSGTNDAYAYPTIAKDSNSKLWVFAVKTAGFGDYRLMTRQSTNANDISAWQTASQVETSSFGNTFGAIVSLSNNSDMYAIWNEGGSLYGKKYTTGSGWDSGLGTSIDTGPGGITQAMSAVSDSSGNVHLVYINSSNYLIYKERTTSWQTAVTLDGTATCEYPTISIFGTDLYVFWIRSNVIYYKKGTSPYTSTYWDSSATTWQSSGTNQYITSSYSAGGNTVFAIWTEGFGPYNIKFDKIASSVDISSSSLATYNSNQRKTFYDSTNYKHWVFYYNGSAIEYAYSSDGLSWTSAGTLSVDTCYFSVWRRDSGSPNYVYIAYYGNDTNLYARRGTLSATSISWDASAYQISSADGGVFYPTIIRDSTGSSGKLWVAGTFSADDGGGGYIKTFMAYRSPNNDDVSGTWTAYNISSSDYTDTYGTIVRLTNQDMYATYLDYGALRGKKWTNATSSWEGSPTTIDSAIYNTEQGTISANSDSSGNVHLVYIDSDQSAKYIQRTTSWQTAVTLDASSGNLYPSVTIDTSSNDLYAFWIRSNTIYYKKGVSPYASGNWDASATTFYNTGTNTYMATSYSSSSNKIVTLWTESSGSTYNVKSSRTSTQTWTHTTSAATLAPPSVHPVLGNAFVGGNDNYVRGMSTTNGAQAWTPVSTGGTIQSRSPVLNISISGSPTYVIYSSSSDGYLYAINASTGAALSGWPKQVTTSSLQGGIAAQNNLTISGQDPTNTDKWVLFIGTYDNVNHASNKLYALDAVSGATLWTQDSISLDIVSSSPCVDSSINTVYFTSYDNSGTQSSLWAVNTVDGSVRWSKALGNISASPTKGGSNIYVATNAGYLYKYPSQQSDPGTYTWRFDATAGGVITGYPWYSSGGKIYFSTTTQGRVYSVNDDGTANTSFGSPNGYVAVTSPSAPLVNSSIGAGKLYVGSTDGKIHELALSDGTESGYSSIGSTVGSPTYDYVKGYLYVGATDGKVYSFNVASGL